MKNILILGAGIYQVPLIKEAQNSGYRVIVTSIKGSYPGFKLADKVYYENTVDKEGILKIAKKENIDAICTTGTDIAMETIAYVCAKLDLTGLSEKAAVLSTNKLEMKKAFMKHGVRTAKYKQVASLVELREAYNSLQRPVILKVVDSSGSRGIIKIEDESLLDESFLELIEETKVGYIIIEEYITGQEFGAQASVRNGKIDFIMLHGDILFHSKTDVPIGHYVPYSVTNEIYEDTVEQIKKSIVALDLDNCAINADFMLSNNQVYVLEIGARAGATNLPELVSIYYGVNYYKYILDLALNKKNDYDFNNEKTACSSLLLIAGKSGELKKIKHDKVNVDLDGFQLDYKVGERVRKFEVGPDRIGHIIMKTNEIIDEKIIDEISNISKQIDIEIT